MEQVRLSEPGQIPEVHPPPAPGRARRTASEQAYGPDAGGVLNQEFRLTVHGVTVIAPAGVRTAAVDRCSEIVKQTLGRNDVAANKMRGARVTMVIIPARVKMTDLPQFARLEDDETFDGRDWENVRGSGGTRAPDGSFAIGVAEENLVAVPGVASGYPAGYSIALHELAHAIHAKGMSDGQQRRLRELYSNRRELASEGNANAFTDSYGASNVMEYFAQSTNAFFGKNEGTDAARVPNKNGREWLRVNDPDMYAFLVDMYETEHSDDRDRDGDGQRDRQR